MEDRRSVLFWSTDRTAAAVTAFALARRVGRRVYWLNIRSRGSGRDEFEEIVAPFVAPEMQDHVTTPFELMTPSTALVGEPNGHALPAERGAELSPHIDQAFDRLRGDSGLSVLLLTNGDRIAGTLGDDCTAFRYLLERIPDSGVKLVVAHAGPAEWARSCFANVGQIETLPGREWSAALLTVEGPAPPERKRLSLGLLDSVKPFLGTPR